MSNADGSPEVTERLLKESRELLDSLAEKLGGEDGSVALDPLSVDDAAPND